VTSLRIVSSISDDFYELTRDEGAELQPLQRADCRRRERGLSFGDRLRPRVIFERALQVPVRNENTSKWFMLFLDPTATLQDAQLSLIERFGDAHSSLLEASRASVLLKIRQYQELFEKLGLCK